MHAEKRKFGIIKLAEEGPWFLIGRATRWTITAVRERSSDGMGQGRERFHTGENRGMSPQRSIGYPLSLNTMTAHQKEVVIGLEGEVFRGGNASPWKLKLSTTIVPDAGGSVTEKDVLVATEDLRNILAAALKNAGTTEMDEGAVASSSGPPRSIEVLNQVYTPRSSEHVDALLWEGQITAAEHSLMMSSIRGTSSPPSSGQRFQRSIEELVKEFHIESLKDANFARAKELISYEEWTALKRHFSEKKT
jgi:hypothetical protein